MTSDEVTIPDARRLYEALASLVDQDLEFRDECIVIRCGSHGSALERVRKARDALAKSRPVEGDVDPIPMLLFCPMCGLQHIDEPTPDWDNPPHRSHLCHACGCVWRPADVATTGVVAIETHGSADTWGESNSAAIAALPPAGVGEKREAALPFFRFHAKSNPAGRREALLASTKLLRDKYESRKCDADAVACCTRCNVMFLVNVVDGVITALTPTTEQGSTEPTNGGEG